MSVVGVEGEERDDFTRGESRQMRARSLRLLGSLVRPVRARVILTMFVIVLSTALQVAGPALIAYGIDARRQRFSEETPFEYKPLADEMDRYRWTSEVTADLHDYNQQDIGI